MRADDPGGVDHILARCTFTAVLDVFVDRVGKQERLLQHHADAPAERVLGDIAHVVSVYQHLAFPDVVEAMDERRDARFAGPGRANQCDDLAGLHLEADVPEHRLAGIVAERHVAKLDRAVDPSELDGAGFVVDIDRYVQHLENALSRSHRPLHHAVLRGQRAYRVEKALHIENKCHHDAQIERAVQNHGAADKDDDSHGAAGQRIDDRAP